MGKTGKKFIINLLSSNPSLSLRFVIFGAGCLLFLFFLFLNFQQSFAQVCLPLTGYLVWPGTWIPGNVPMASTSQYYLTNSPIYVSGSNVGIGYVSPVYKLQVQGDISGTRLCIGSDCRSVWPGGGIAGTGSAGQVAFWTSSSEVGGDSNLFWDNTNKRLGISTTTPISKLHVIGSVTADTFIGTISATNVSSGQFGANTGGGDYSFPGKVGIGTTTPDYRLTLSGEQHPRLMLRSNTTGLTNEVAIMFENSDGTEQFEIGLDKDGQNSFRIGNRSFNKEYMTILNTGNVGIGTVAPVSLLELSKTNSSTILTITAATSTTYSPQIAFRTGTTPSTQYTLGVNITDNKLKLVRGSDIATSTGITIDSSGNVGIRTTNPIYTLHVNGSFAASSKNFDIQDPRYNDPNKRLVHATLEGPEYAVFYRGEDQLKDGLAIVELPPYFEALTRKEGRTILLTPKFEEDEPVSSLVASEIVDGKFKVKAIDNKNPYQKFYWEVKAIRADILPLQPEKLNNN